MASKMQVMVEDLEDGDLANFSAAEVLATSFQEIPDEYLTIAGEPEDVDKFTTRVNVDGGYVIVPRATLLDYDGNVFEDIQYAAYTRQH